MARVESIIVGGGIAVTNPFTVNTLPVIVSSTPPALSDSVFKQSANARSLSMGSGAAFGAGNDQLAIGTGVVLSGNVVGQVAIGRNITSSLTSGFDPSILIGNGIVAGGNSSCVIMNAGVSSLTLAAGAATVFIGTVSGDAGLLSVTIGSGITTTVSQSGNTLVGFGIFCSSGAAGDNTMVGRQAQGVGCVRNTALGSSTNFGSSSTDGSILIGFAAQIQNANANNIVIGRSSTLGASVNAAAIILGSGMTSNVAALGNTFVLGGSLTVISKMLVGRGPTHTASIGGFTLSCTDGVTTVDLAMGALTIIAPRSTGNAVSGHIVFQTGAPGASGAALQAATTQFRVLSSAGGGGVASIDIANVTNGAGALAGTLGNSPVLGDPTFWIPIQVNGAVKHVPAW